MARALARENSIMVKNQSCYYAFHREVALLTASFWPLAGQHGFEYQPPAARSWRLGEIGLGLFHALADHLCAVFHQLAIAERKRCGEVAVDIEFADNLAVRKNGYHDF